MYVGDRKQTENGVEGSEKFSLECWVGGGSKVSAKHSRRMAGIHRMAGWGSQIFTMEGREGGIQRLPVQPPVHF